MPIPHLRQGTLDGLCGIYALLNAIFQRIYHDRGLAYKHQDEHFKRAMGCLPKTSILTAVTDGLTCNELLKLSTKFLKNYRLVISPDEFKIEAGRPFLPQQFSNNLMFHTEIRKIYLEQRTAVILGVSYRMGSQNRRAELNKTGHWLALRACKPSGFYVVNNQPGENFISKNTQMRTNDLRAVIDYDDTIVLRAVKTKKPSKLHT